MTLEELRLRLDQGEGVSLEFKRCGSKPEKDVFETICSFANRQGGDIFLGINDDGSIAGIDKDRIVEIQRNIVNVVNNQNVFNVAPAVEVESVDYGEAAVLRIWVPFGPSVYRFKGEVYDRVGDVDVRLKSDAQISGLYIRKQDYFSERKVYPFLRMDDLRDDLFPRIRLLAESRRTGHPWLGLSNEELLKSAGLYIHDPETGMEGFTRAAALLVGTDEAIASVCPAYRTDAVVRIQDKDRYDDRLTVKTNLIDAYDQLLEFMQKHLPDRFYLEGVQNVSIRDVICRELVANSLMHREYSSTLPAQIFIEGDGVRTVNASRSVFSGKITLDSFSPRPKNPLIEGFFAQIGRAEELGSGTRILFKYAPIYSGSEPVLEEGDVFQAFVSSPDIREIPGSKEHSDAGRRAVDDAIARLLDANGYATVSGVMQASGASRRTVSRRFAQMTANGVLKAEGATRNRRYVR